ncbi:inovirus Gp2 family protein [Pseudoalteromonas sp. OFAV1]|uniref:YagK/YfjJ domain-containing protein n=1 Tax=Pseudoalteromonas sp. OFAV1 TaxID=2908892 RepID=UPI001F428823|nr:inovirus-type Gp2 protein [Pseudoalteromonas sp. OFAV1]MCF2902535.1 inovirus Gp2 family protein [Pseudoalteromonas sp. OFAV1]
MTQVKYIEELKEKYGFEKYYSEISNSCFIEFDIMKFEHGYHEKILDRATRQLDAMLIKTTKVLFVRIDLHVKEKDKSNSIISNFFKASSIWIKEKYDQFGYVWVREQGKSNKQHYHLAYFLNGHKIRHPKLFIEFLKQKWQETSLGGVLSIPNNCFLRLFINQDDFLENLKCTIYRLSYLAKKHTKRRVSQFTKNYSSSRLRYV